MLRSTIKRRCIRAFAAGAALSGTFAWLGSVPAHAQPAFYHASKGELAGEPGTVIRQEPIVGAPLGAQAYWVLYRSTGLEGEPIATSGLVIIPQGPSPAGGRHVISWAHPTTGIVPRCAPSLAIFKFQQIQGLRDMIARGYIVAATDYPGLGTPGPHPYLVGVSEARAVLDSVRAARGLARNDVARSFAVWGHSQGGQAALYAGILAKEYAPDLELVGVAAAAPATDLATLLKEDFATPGGKNLLAMTLWSWSHVFSAPLDKIVDSAALPTINRLAQVCLESPFDIWPRRQIASELQKKFLAVDNVMDLEPWKSLLAQNTVGTLPPSMPLFLAQGSIDGTVLPSVTRAYMRRQCEAGGKVTLLMMPGVGHGAIAMRSARAAVDWIGERFSGARIPSDCASY
jgi:acetyl esterase/lipase